MQLLKSILKSEVYSHTRRQNLLNKGLEEKGKLS